MDNLKTELDRLDTEQLSYVWERAVNLNHSLTAILKRIGVSRSKFYEMYDLDTRERLDKLALQLARDFHYQTLQLASEQSIEAMKTLVHLMQHSESDQTRLGAAKLILEYTLGKPKAQLDVTSSGNSLQLYANVSPDDWDDGDE